MRSSKLYRTLEDNTHKKTLPFDCAINMFTLAKFFGYKDDEVQTIEIFRICKL